MSKAELRYQAIENSGLHVCLGDQLVPLWPKKVLAAKIAENFPVPGITIDGSKLFFLKA